MTISDAVSEPVPQNTRSLFSRASVFFIPNRLIDSRSMYLLALVEVILLIGVWTIGPGVFPSPLEVLAQFPSLLEDGLVGNLISSLLLSVEAILLSSLIAGILAYSSASGVMRPITQLISTFRFLSLVGTGVFFHAFVGSGHGMKLAMLTFAMGVFILSSLRTEVLQVPIANLDYVRSMRASPLRVVWEAQVMGTSGKAADIIIDAAAMAWLTLTAVEGIVRSEGGIGVMLLSENKHYNIAGIIAVQIVFLVAGLIQDVLLRTLKSTFLHHTNYQTT